MSDRYSQSQAEQVKWIYILGIILWLIICFLLKLIPANDFFEYLIIALPIVVFVFSWYYADRVSTVVEDYMGKTNVLTLGLIIALPLLNWVQDRGPEKKQFIQIMAVAIIFSMLTLIDLWVGHEELHVIRHAESALQTMAITLLIFGLYRYFIDPHPKTNLKSMILKKSDSISVSIPEP